MGTIYISFLSNYIMTGVVIYCMYIVNCIYGASRLSNKILSEPDAKYAINVCFSRYYAFDKMEQSINRINWINITKLTKSFIGQSFSQDTIIAQAVLAVGSGDLSYDKTYGNDEREFDNIQITAT